MIRQLENILKRKRKVAPTRKPVHLILGEWGEHLALRYLKECEDYRIVATNFRTPLRRGATGRRGSGEIDIIAYDGATLAFVEVKTRSSEEIATADSAVDLRKQKQIANAARRFRILMRLSNLPYRFDVLTIVKREPHESIELHKGYFTDRPRRRHYYT